MLNADLIFFTDSSMNIGGQELQALQQMHSLNHVGFECILLCKPHSAISKRARDQGITLHEIPFRNAFHIPSFRQILRTIREKKPTAIICHGSHDALICAFAAKWISLFFAVHIAVYRVKTFQHGHPLSFAYNYLFTKTLTPSSYLRSLFLVNPMINPHKINVLYPGIDFSRLGNSGDSLPNHALEWLASHPGPVIAHGAILRGEKGHSVILKALVEVKKKFPTIRYLMAGEGQERAFLEKVIKELGLENNAYLIGILQDIAPLLKVSTIAVLPSLIEPLGMFQIEAQYLEVPTIVSRAGGIPETILHQETGLMVEPGNVSAWVKAICWMLENPTEAKCLGEKGKAFVTTKFSRESNTAQLIELIKH